MSLGRRSRVGPAMIRPFFFFDGHNTNVIFESGSFRSYSCSVTIGLGRFGPISKVSRFGPTGAGRFGPVLKMGHFGPI